MVNIGLSHQGEVNSGEPNSPTTKTEVRTEATFLAKLCWSENNDEMKQVLFEQDSSREYYVQLQLLAGCLVIEVFHSKYIPIENFATRAYDTQDFSELRILIPREGYDTSIVAQRGAEIAFDLLQMQRSKKGETERWKFALDIEGREAQEAAKRVWNLLAIANWRLNREPAPAFAYSNMVPPVPARSQEVEPMRYRRVSDFVMVVMPANSVKGGYISIRKPSAKQSNPAAKILSEHLAEPEVLAKLCDQLNEEEAAQADAEISKYRSAIGRISK